MDELTFRFVELLVNCNLGYNVPRDRASTEAGKQIQAMSKVSDLYWKWMKNQEYWKDHEELASEFALARVVIEAPVTAGLTKEQLAQRMDNTQSIKAQLTFELVGA